MPHPDREDSGGSGMHLDVGDKGSAAVVDDDGQWEDFTCATPWEDFVRSLEDVLRDWKLCDTGGVCSTA